MTSFSSEHTNEEEQDTSHGTPPEIVGTLAEIMPGGTFDLDPAARLEWEREEAPASEQFCDELLTEEDEPDGLSAEWHGHVFINPPYGRKENPTWAEKIREELDNVESVTALVPASTSADWFQATYSKFDVLCFPDHRIEFVNPDNFAPAGFDSMLAAAGDLPDGYTDRLGEIGLTAGVR